MTVKTSISLTDEQEVFARSLVDSGQYASLSAVLQRGLDMLRHDSELRAAELAALLQAAGFKKIRQKRTNQPLLASVLVGEV